MELRVRVKRTYAHDFVECCIGADTELRSWNIVAYRGRDQNHRNTELRILVSRLGQHQRTVVGLQRQLLQCIK